MTLRKWVVNCAVVVTSALPNLAITLGTVTVLDVIFRWSGAMAVLAYLIGQALSVQWSAWFLSRTRAEFTVFGRTFRYSKSRKK